MFLVRQTILLVKKTNRIDRTTFEKEFWDATWLVKRAPWDQNKLLFFSTFFCWDTIHLPITIWDARSIIAIF